MNPADTTNIFLLIDSTIFLFSIYLLGGVKSQKCLSSNRPDFIELLIIPHVLNMFCCKKIASLVIKISLLIQLINYALKYAEYDRSVMKASRKKKREDFQTRALVKCLLEIS